MSRINERLEDTLESITDRIHHGLDRGKFTWDEVQSAVVTRGRQAARRTDDYVHEHSWQVVGIATLVGVAIGFLLHRR